MNTKFIKQAAAFLLAAVTVLPLFGCGTDKTTQNAELKAEDFNAAGVKIGVETGSTAMFAVEKLLPNAQMQQFTDKYSGYLAVKDGKIDAFAFERRQMEYAIKNGQKGVRLLDENLGEDTNVAVGLSPKSSIPDLETKMNDFIAKIKADGTFDDMYERWITDGNETMPDVAPAKEVKYHLVVGTTGIVQPYSYYKDTKLNGFDIELAKRFAAEIGADLKFKVYGYDSIVAAALSGDIDCIMANLNVTPERLEKIKFSDPLTSIQTTLMIKDDTKETESDGVYSSLSQLKNKRIGILSGSVFDRIAAEHFPDAKTSYYTSVADLITALQSNKIDGYLVDETNIKETMQKNDKMTYIPEYVTEFDNAFVFAKNSEGKALCAEMSAFLDEMRESGELDALLEKWNDSDAETLDYTELPDINGSLVMATEAGFEPFEFIRNNKIVGYEIELAALFCAKNGYALTVENMNFDGVLPAVQTGKCDFAGAMITITDERKESVDFSSSAIHTGSVMAVLKKESAADASFAGSVKSSFERTFIRENRWKLFLSGIGTTMLITVLAILFGTMLGFAVFMLCRGGNAAANLLTRFFIWLIHGMPTVVLLMILYYIVFSGISINGVWVAVAGFTLTFGSAVYGMLVSGTKAVDKGQTEAAYALGYSDTQTFFKIILPQAALHFMPSYKAEIVSLIKATAVVGYIAVQDLTKMGDIVRSRTYEAFFPLIAVAVIYFILAGILTFFVKKINIKIDPKQRKRELILKGVKTDDKA